VTASPRFTVALSVAFAMVAMVGGTLLALGSSIPISPYVTTISFAFYVLCRLIGSRRGWRRSTRPAAEEIAEPVPEAAVPAHHP
jgi:zinc/manganese transport system permease protein